MKFFGYIVNVHCNSGIPQLWTPLRLGLGTAQSILIIHVHVHVGGILISLISFREGYHSSSLDRIYMYATNLTSITQIAVTS